MPWVVRPIAMLTRRDAILLSARRFCDLLRSPCNLYDRRFEPRNRITDGGDDDERTQFP
jgi:hypothetical protein